MDKLQPAMNLAAVLTPCRCEKIYLSKERKVFKEGVKVSATSVKRVPVTTAWGVLRLRMEELPPDMEGSWEGIE
jgi:hypothetical protein